MLDMLLDLELFLAWAAGLMLENSTFVKNFENYIQGTRKTSGRGRFGRRSDLLN